LIFDGEPLCPVPHGERHRRRLIVYNRGLHFAAQTGIPSPSSTNSSFAPAFRRL
jgi:hypothetical protein